ncbi:MAG: hypothetical protein HGB34_04535 [Candidatus Moranbacteria bacterium]|nr:hypothetical protein [Candidatus Moranbacteria bacterium]
MLQRQSYFSPETSDALLKMLRPAMVFPTEQMEVPAVEGDDLLMFLLGEQRIPSGHFVQFVLREIGPNEASVAINVQLRWPADLWTLIFDEFIRIVINGADGFALKGKVLVRPNGRHDARKEILGYMMTKHLLTESDIADAVHLALIEIGEAQATMIAERGLFADECDSPHALGYAFANRRIEDRDSISYRHGESMRYYMNLSCALLTDVMDQLFANT